MQRHNGNKQTAFNPARCACHPAGMMVCELIPKGLGGRYSIFVVCAKGPAESPTF